jgi:hypothetical protein
MASYYFNHESTDFLCAHVYTFQHLKRAGRRKFCYLTKCPLKVMRKWTCSTNEWQEMHRSNILVCKSECKEGTIQRPRYAYVVE